LNSFFSCFSIQNQKGHDKWCHYKKSPLFSPPIHTISLIMLVLILYFIYAIPMFIYYSDTGILYQTLPYMTIYCDGRYLLEDIWNTLYRYFWKNSEICTNLPTMNYCLPSSNCKNCNFCCCILVHILNVLGFININPNNMTNNLKIRKIQFHILNIVDKHKLQYRKNKIYTMLSRYSVVFMGVVLTTSLSLFLTPLIILYYNNMQTAFDY